MTNNQNIKKYDLDFKQKGVKEFQKPSIFDESSSNEDETNKIPTLSFCHNFKKQDTSKLEKALQEDPTIYDYDSIHDSISTAKPKNIEPTEKRTKFAKSFIKSAEKKNMRYQVVLSKKAKRENEADKKEVFVTSAYKKEREKILDVAREDEDQEEREKKYESSKQPGSWEIYSYMLNEKLNSTSKSHGTSNDKPSHSKTDSAKIVNEEILTTTIGKEVKPEEDEIIKMAFKEKLAREKASLIMQKPDNKYMLLKYAKKNDESSIKSAKERYLSRKNVAKRKFVDEDSD